MADNRSKKPSKKVKLNKQTLSEITGGATPYSDPSVLAEQLIKGRGPASIRSRRR